MLSVAERSTTGEHLVTGHEVVQLAARSTYGPPIRTHLSPRPLTRVREVEQDGRRASAMGLWFDLHCGWMIEAVRRGQDEIFAGRYLYRVELGESRILQVATASAFDDFEETYATLRAATVLWTPSALSIIPKVVQGRHIDWRAVSADYDGIEIAPYRQDRAAWTDERAWYMNWDIASGCVWRPRGVRLTFLGRIPGYVTPWAAPNPVRSERSRLNDTSRTGQGAARSRGNGRVRGESADRPSSRG